jgi:hypothetical protein
MVELMGQIWRVHNTITKQTIPLKTKYWINWKQLQQLRQMAGEADLAVTPVFVHTHELVARPLIRSIATLNAPDTLPPGYDTTFV